MRSGEVMDARTKLQLALLALANRLRAERLRQRDRHSPQPPQPDKQIIYCRDCDVPEGMDW
ncbi:hypothetical protein [Chamaesiphon sp. VAR_48_metabat_403]|uniref:hypothetical protein n=1 Tax=Chamaesiphon sp. VAR_48_metabat_403 TaxID=2964700 RepID=UPI00286DCF38|nr:hypothetical protein [Chamaesiphon sp. VAR_48_metabat_403]